MKIHLLAASAIAVLVAIPGTVKAQDTTTEKGKVSYALGYRAGMDIARVVGSGEQLDMATVMKAFQDAASRKDPAVPPEQLGSALQAMQGRMVAKSKAEMEKRAADNKTKGDAFLAQNKYKPGVNVLASGVQYRVIELGNGSKPTLANQITVEFKSTLPDGNVVADTSVPSEGQPAGPVTVRLSEIPLPGLRETLQMMPTGARWEVVLPGSAAHGTTVERASEMANQVLLFNIKLIEVGPVVAAPKK
jgi:peptidylprolyl isomerase